MFVWVSINSFIIWNLKWVDLICFLIFFCNFFCSCCFFLCMFDCILKLWICDNLLVNFLLFFSIQLSVLWSYRFHKIEALLKWVLFVTNTFKFVRFKFRLDLLIGFLIDFQIIDWLALKDSCKDVGISFHIDIDDSHIIVKKLHNFVEIWKCLSLILLSLYLMQSIFQKSRYYLWNSIQEVK